MSEQRAGDVSIRIDERLAHLSRKPSEHCIFRIHDKVRMENEKVYEPEILAIGPYHHGKKNLQVMEEHKLHYLQLLLNRRNETSVNRYVMAMRGLEERARKYYAEAISLDKDDFVEMMILDGFFIIELVRKYKMRELIDDDDPIFQMPSIRYCLRCDLMLFENQIPFFVLVELFNMTSDGDTPDSIINLCLHFFKATIGGDETILQVSNRVKNDHVKHLLGLLHYSFCFSFVETLSQTSVGHESEQCDPINSTKELQEAGIEFRKANVESLMNIKFINGVLEIPSLPIGGMTEVLLNNLIAYEQHLPDDQPCYVNDYIFFMTCLINSPNDVEILRHCGIIVEGHDVAVCTMMDRLRNNVDMSWGKCYSEVFINVNKHCKGRCNTWMAILRRKYFNNPWALISFLGGVALLLLTAIQTIFSSLPYV